MVNNLDEKYFVVKVNSFIPDEESGKIKKIVEQKLVKAFNCTDAEAKVTEKYQNLAYDWRVTSAVESRIDEVIE